MPQAKSEPAAGPPGSSAVPQEGRSHPRLGWKQKSYDLATFTSYFVLTPSTPRGEKSKVVAKAAATLA